MKFNPQDVLDGILKDHSTIKIIEIKKQISSAEFDKARLSGVEVKDIIRDWFLESIANALIENSLLSFEAERKNCYIVELTCMMLAINSRAIKKEV